MHITFKCNVWVMDYCGRIDTLSSILYFSFALAATFPLSSCFRPVASCFMTIWAVKMIGQLFNFLTYLKRVCVCVCVCDVDKGACVCSGPVQYKVTAMFTFRAGSESVCSEVPIAVSVDASLRVYVNACYCSCLALLGRCRVPLHWRCTWFHVITSTLLFNIAFVDVVSGWSIHSSIHSFIHSFTHSFIQSFSHSFIHSFLHSLIHW